MACQEREPNLYNFYDDNWTWDIQDKSPEVSLEGPDLKMAKFHQDWSRSTAGVRGTRSLNGGRHYWEINIADRIYGTSMMIGIATKKAALHIDDFVNMLGKDEHGWGLSHHGLIWHRGSSRMYSRCLRDGEPVTIGLLFDGIKGNLTYYRDGKSLGTAFVNLHLVKEDIYPAICSTAAETDMSLGIAKREFSSLQDRCRTVIVKSLQQEIDVRELPLPKLIKRYLSEAMSDESLPQKLCECECCTHYYSQ